MTTYRSRAGAPVSALQLDDEDLLALPQAERDKAIAELAKDGHHLAVVVIDVSAPCTNQWCVGGKVRMQDGTRVDCHTCDGSGAVDGRSVCLVPGCLGYGRPLRPTLTGWECARVHGHGAPPLPADVEAPTYGGPEPSGAIMSEAEIDAELKAAGWIVQGWLCAHPITGAFYEKRAAHSIMRKERAVPRHRPAPKDLVCDASTGLLRAAQPQRDSDPFPWDAPIYTPNFAQIVERLNDRLGDLEIGNWARAELSNGAIVIAMPGDTTVEAVEAIAATIADVAKTWPGERPRVTGRVET